MLHMCLKETARRPNASAVKALYSETTGACRVLSEVCLQVHSPRRHDSLQAFSPVCGKTPVNAIMNPQDPKQWTRRHFCFV
jgi:hypothetical protein